MAVLMGLEGVGFELGLEEERSEANQRWLDYCLILKVAGNEKKYCNKNQNQDFGKFSFNISERNELEAFAQQLESFLTNPAKKEMFIEPADPSFELNICRTMHSDNEFKVYLWIDAGNSTRLEYTWDAEGIRFLATQEALEKFSKEISNYLASVG